MRRQWDGLGGFAGGNVLLTICRAGLRPSIERASVAVTRLYWCIGVIGVLVYDVFIPDMYILSNSMVHVRG